MKALAKLDRIAVLVSVGHHRVSGVSCYSRNDAAALEIARSLAKQHGAQLEVVHAGDASNPALTDYLALGAPRIDVLACGDSDDAAALLAERLRGVPLVLTGTRAEGAYDTGMLPYRLADALGYALIDSALDLSMDDDRLVVTQFLPKGFRRSVDAALPAVVAVHPQAAVTPRYAYARAVAGTIEPQRTAPARDANAGAWQIGPVQRKPIKLVAAEKRSGHARMMTATTTESRGGNVVIEGSSVEKAQAILGYLREHRLIDY
ncbi:electron transfer flavoprotein subunit beta/FixA family protein [Trinickia dinghuensis]|uniref:Electron transfer flavoprotein subunit beta/FixA family protein n=1 Tax=Trinickia dinghuensis TaxID=2291023 RepID=A0A3D8JTS1_9BURK|nr:electron transfer flavoprotein subunit beta/FixA family protein [Trinickia dinghuensis]RDU96202.1 electron transfer flavoprotein subunit beta/FixA family protein [Trinickia dinghuensis]